MQQQQQENSPKDISAGELKILAAASDLVQAMDAFAAANDRYASIVNKSDRAPFDVVYELVPDIAEKTLLAGLSGTLVRLLRDHPDRGVVTLQLGEWVVNVDAIIRKRKSLHDCGKPDCSVHGAKATDFPDLIDD